MRKVYKHLLIILIASTVLMGWSLSVNCRNVKGQNGNAAFGYKLLEKPNAGNISKALRIFKKVLVKNPRSIPAHMGIVYALLYQYALSGRKNEGILLEGLTHVNAVLGYNPKIADAYKKKSYLLFYLERKNEAVSTLRIGMARIPKSRELLKAYLALLIKLGQFKEAQKTCALKKSRFKNLPEFHIELGNIWLDAGYTKQARECFTRSISEHETPEAWAAIAGSFIREKNWQKAIWFFEWALNVDPNFFDVYYDLAACHKHMGNIKKAIVWLVPYTEAFPDDIRALMELALLYEENGKNTRARLVWMKVKTRSRNKRDKMIASKRIKKLRNKRKK